MAEPMIQVRDVSKDFLLPHLRSNTLKSHVLNLWRRRQTLEVQHALRDINFDVAQGEFLGMVGRNGSGKSTLLKILAGIYRPTKGYTIVNGRLVPFIELGVGFNPELTGRQNVYLNGALLGFSKSEVAEMYDDIVTFAELEGSMDQKLKFYSSGMQVRIAFSIATRARADILLIDEVLAVGDTAFQRKCFEHFHALKKRATTIVFVTHNMSAVREFCDRAILIEDSRIAAVGGAEEIAERYTQLFTSTGQGTQAGEAPPGPIRRWGEGHARYTSVEVPTLLTDEDEIVLKLEAVAARDVDEAVYGFVISDSSGTPIMGTDSEQKKEVCGGLREGEGVYVQWSIPNVFRDGVHTVEITITDRQGLTIYDLWKEAATFRVVKEEKTPYLVSPDTTFSFARVSD